MLSDMKFVGTDANSAKRITTLIDQPTHFFVTMQSNNTDPQLFPVIRDMDVLGDIRAWDLDGNECPVVLNAMLPLPGNPEIRKRFVRGELTDKELASFQFDQQSSQLVVVVPIAKYSTGSTRVKEYFPVLGVIFTDLMLEVKTTQKCFLTVEHIMLPL
jgi:hypothetical protein